jgi:predicted lysophospholipase L1 biosynthesis ABC-type transport system permease subunit
MECLWNRSLSNKAARRFLNTQFVLTWSRDMPPATQILEGSWWPSQPETPLVSVQEFAAQALGLKIGSVIEWTALGGNVKARVANIRKTDAIRVAPTTSSFCLRGPSIAFPSFTAGALRVKPRA